MGKGHARGSFLGIGLSAGPAAALQDPAARRAGASLVLDHLFNLLVVVALLWLCAALGRRILRLAGCHRKDPVERLAVAVALGGGLLATLILIIGVAGLLRPVPMVVLLATIAWASRSEILSLPDLLHDTGRRLRTLGEGPGGRAAALVFGIVALFVTVQALAPVTDWDSLMYHVRVPAQFLERGAVFLPEDNLHVTRIGLIHLLYVPLLAAGAEAGPALLGVGLTVLLGLAVASLCDRLFSQRTAKGTLALLWGSPVLILVAITPRVDVSLAFYAFLAHAMLLGLLAEGYDRASFLVAAVLLGFAFGVKYQGAVYGLALAPLIVRTALIDESPSPGTVRRLAPFAVLGLVAALPWLLKNVHLVGSPLYPFLADRMAQPWLAAFYPAGPPPALEARELYDWIWEIRRSFNLRDYFLAPERLTIEGEGSFYRANPILLLLPLWLLYARERFLNWLLVPALVYVGILLAVSPHTNLRYLIPALIPLTIVAVHVVMDTLDRTPHRLARMLLVVVAGAALLPTAEVIAFWSFHSRAPLHAVGAISTRQYLEGHLAGVAHHARVVRELNRRLPSDSRVLMLFDARGYGIEADVVQDNKVTNWPFLADRVRNRGCLEEGDFTHVLVNAGALAYYESGGLDLEVLRWPAFQDFARRCLIPVHRLGLTTLYEVVDRPASTSVAPAPSTQGG